MRERAFVGWIIAAVAVALPTLALSQVARQTRTLVVNGHSGDTAIVEIEGRSYVELEALVRIANGSLRFNGNQISVTLPAGGGGSERASATPPPANPGFSKEFLKAGIEQMAVIREWRTALTNAIERGYPVTEDWVAPYRSQRFLDANQSMTMVPTDALKGDPLDQKIVNCGHSLAAMASSGQFVDDGSCQ
jgi:hypothetical protein